MQKYELPKLSVCVTFLITSLNKQFHIIKFFVSLHAVLKAKQPITKEQTGVCKLKAKKKKKKKEKQDSNNICDEHIK